MCPGNPTKLSIQSTYRGKPVLTSQGTREEGYTDPATAAQDAMVTGQPWGNRGTLGMPAWGRGATWRPVMFQVLWESCQKRTGEHKTLLQMILCNKSYQQLWLGNCPLFFTAIP